MNPHRIQQLDEETIGHIAAGEVVERPAQVVKELIENSLDAGATLITVHLERGGFERLQVDDNGSGIHRDDLSLALDRHATSKLKHRDDLAAINSLGFRGEALASIGMVSTLEIASRPHGEDGAAVRMVQGTKSKIEPMGMQHGTRITVDRLFENTPARLAFQRRPETETARVVDVVVSHALAHPEAAFTLKTPQRVLLNVPLAHDPMDRLYDVLGAQASELLPLSAPPQDNDAPGSERWTGHISTPDITRGKGSDIHVLINGRPVASGPFHQAIRRGYKTRLMQGRHPVAVLHLTCPPEDVDVNVHPTKSEVRLRHSWRVLERLERSIAHSLETIPTEPEAGGALPELRGLDDHRPGKSVHTHFEPSTTLTSASGLKERPNTLDRSTTPPPAWAVAASEQLNLAGQTATAPERPDKARPTSASPLGQAVLPTGVDKPMAAALSSAERDLHRHAGTVSSTSPSSEPPLEGVLNDLPPMEPLAQFADSYILVQAEDELLLIDQHALHERIRYERLRHAGQAWEPQARLEPLHLELDARQDAVLEAQHQRLWDLGFHTERQDGAWHLLASPRLLKPEAMRPFFLDVLQDVAEDGGPIETVEDKMDHIAFMTACRGAVKANEQLTLPEMRRLIDDMRRIPNPWACVHGRPTALRIQVDDLDHHFGRHG